MANPFFFFFIIIFLYTVTIPPLTITGATSCRTLCGNIPINYPFGIDQGCGSPQFKEMFNCSTDLFFLTPSGSYKVQRIDYEKNTMVVFDPAMSTCSILQPHHDFKMSDIQNAIIRPSYDTVFALLNCTDNSPVHNRYRNLCFNFPGHSCDELYSSCTSFRIFNTTTPSGNSTVRTTPYCCFTSYDTVRVMSMNILDCSHYTTVIDGGKMRDVAPLDWSYGIELSYSVPEIGCDRCRKSGGVCGFDAETEIFLCQCSATNNPTRECGGGRRSWPVETLRKIKEASENWFVAQVVDSNLRQAEEEQNKKRKAWKLPPAGWKKCNIACSWSHQTRKCGGAWVLRDNDGNVLLHSRRTFANLGSNLEARKRVLEWAIANMTELKLDNLIFASEDVDLLGVILRPSAWPSFIAEVVEVLKFFGLFTNWRLHVEETSMNKGAHLIAHSAVRDDRCHSYVAEGSPLWLKDFFENERVLAYV